jgi:hypothetical protein
MNIRTKEESKLATDAFIKYRESAANRSARPARGTHATRVCSHDARSNSWRSRQASSQFLSVFSPVILWITTVKWAYALFACRPHSQAPAIVLIIESFTLLLYRNGTWELHIETCVQIHHPCEKYAEVPGIQCQIEKLFHIIVSKGEQTGLLLDQKELKSLSAHWRDVCEIILGL